MGGSAVNSAVTLNSAAGTNSVSVTANTKGWTNSAFTAAAAGVLEFSFGAITPSTTVSPLVITGLAAFTATPTVSIVGSNALAQGTYPLMTRATTSGTVPTVVTVTPTPLGVASLSDDGTTLSLVIAPAIIVKADNQDDLTNTTSWVGAVVPGTSDVAKWDNTVTSDNTTLLGADTTWGGINISNPVGTVTISAGNTLTIGAAAKDIDMSTATTNLTLNCDLALGAANVWEVAAGQNLTVGGVVSGASTLTKQGAGTVTLSGANTFTNKLTVSDGTVNLTGNRTVVSTAAQSYDIGGTGIPLATLNIGGDLPLGATQVRVGVNGPGTATQTNGLVSFTGGNQITVGASASMPGIYNLSGGTLSLVNVTDRGLLLGVNSSCTGTFNLSDSGILTMASGSVVEIGRSEGSGSVAGTTGTFNQTGGTATVATLRMGGGNANNANTTAALNLSGGTFSALSFGFLSGGNTSTSSIAISGTADVTLPAFPTVRGTDSQATLSFDGGTLRPAAASTVYISNLTAAYIQDGGGKINTDNGSITIVQPLVEDPGSTGGGLTKEGTNILTLTGTNTYTGGTTISAGTLQIGSGGTSGSIASTAGVTNNSALVYNRSDALSVGYVISGGGSLSKTGAGTLTMTNANTYTGGTTISAGTLQIGSGGTSGSIASTAGVTNNTALVYNRSDALNVPYPISGSGNVTNLGTGTVTLSGGGDLTGNLIVAAGTVQLGALNGISTNAGLELAANGTTSAILDLNGYDQTLSKFVYTATDAAGNLTITGASSKLTINSAGITEIGPGGTISATRNVTVDMSGLGEFIWTNSLNTFRVGARSGSTISATSTATVTLAATNTITATQLVVAEQGFNASPGTGILHLGQSNVLNASAINVGYSGRTTATLDFNTGLTSPTVRIRGTDGTADVNSWDVGRVNHTSASTFTARVDFSGGQLDARVSGMRIGAADTGVSTTRQGTENAFFTMGKGTLNVTNLSIGLLLGSGSAGTTFRGNGTFTVNDAAGTLTADNIYLGVINNTLTGANIPTTTSTFNLGAGTLEAKVIDWGATAPTGLGTATRNFNFTNGIVRNYAGSDLTISNVTFNLTGSGIRYFEATAGQSITVASVIAGSGQGFTKIGGGMLNFPATNTYTGNTTVSNGTLAIAVASIANPSTVAVASPGVLQLDFATTNRVAALVLNGVTQPGGVYNNANTPTYITGTGSLKVNSAPVALAVTNTVAQGESVSITNDPGKLPFATDADGDPLTFALVTGAAQGTVSVLANGFTYSSTNTTSNITDTFQYSVADGFGGLVTNTMSVYIGSAEGANLISATSLLGKAYLTYLGIPGQSYVSELATNLLPPITWTPVATNTAGATNGLTPGMIFFTNDIVPPTSFFRTQAQ